MTEPQAEYITGNLTAHGEDELIRMDFRANITPAQLATLKRQLNAMTEERNALKIYENVEAELLAAADLNRMMHNEKVDRLVAERAILEVKVQELTAELAAVKHIIEDGNPTYVGQINALLDEREELRAYADTLAAGLPVGMLPQDVENLRRANEQFAVDVDAMQLQLSEATFENLFTAQMMAIHAVNTGNGFSTGDREFQEKLIEEVNEVFEETANNGIDGDLVNELADVCIAIMFYCAGNNLPLAAAIEAKNAHNKTRGWKHGKGE